MREIGVYSVRIYNAHCQKSFLFIVRKLQILLIYSLINLNQMFHLKNAMTKDIVSCHGTLIVIIDMFNCL